jgi:branched-chain amino acid transport system permease protein
MFRHRFIIDLVVAFIIFGIFALVPMLAPPDIVFICGLLLCTILFSLSWAFLFAGAGVLSFGHAAFYGGAAYFVGYTTTFMDWPFLWALIAVAILMGLTGTILGLALLRHAKGVYFAILTLALAEVVRTLITKVDVLGRADGLVGLVRPSSSLFEFPFLKNDGFYYTILVIVFICGGLLYWVARSRFGRILRGIRSDEERMEFMGIETLHYKSIALGISAAFSAIAGGLVGPWLQVVTPSLLHWSTSAQPVIYTLLGGAEVYWGPVLGSSLFSVVTYSTRQFFGLVELIMGMLLLIVVLWFRTGILQRVIPRE